MEWIVKYRAEFKDLYGINWKIDIEQDGFKGEITDLHSSGDPLAFEWLNDSDDIFEPIQPGNAILSFNSLTNFALEDLYSVEDMQFRVKIYEDTVLYWTGYIITKNYSEPYEDTPYVVTVKASCGLEVLSNILYDNDGEYYNGRRLYSQIIIDILGKIGHSGFTEYINIYEGSMSKTIDDSPLDQVMIDSDLFQDMYCDEVLKELLKIFNAKIAHKKGTFVIYRPVELAGATVYGRIFTAAQTKTSTNFSSIKYINRSSHSSSLNQTPGGVEMIQSPAKKVTINQNYGNKNSWLDNYEFKGETFDETDFNFWTQASGSNIKLISDIIPGETDGVFIDSNGSSKEYYIEQIFGSSSRYSYTDELVFEFDYLLYNSSATPQGNVPFYIYMECHTTVYNGSLYEWDENECQFEITPSYITIQNISPVGSSGWYHWKRKIVGLNAGYLIIRIFSTNNANSHVAIKNIVIKAISGEITRIPTVTGGRERQSNSTSKWIMAKYYRLEPILQKKYNPVITLTGGIDLDYDYLLGDVTDADIDNVNEQFAGSLMAIKCRIDTITLTGGTGKAQITCSGLTKEIQCTDDDLVLAASLFASLFEDNYLAIGVVVTSDDVDIIFKGTDDFSTATIIVPTLGTLDGDVVITQEFERSYTTDWLPRPFTGESKPLMEKIGDEIANEYSRAKKLIQLPIIDKSIAVSALDQMAHYEDDVNKISGNNRKFVMNRADFDVKNRSWMIDMMEIIAVAQEEQESITADDTFVTADDTTITIDHM